MEILLLLSAFLTALTGAITGTRPVQQGAAAVQVGHAVGLRTAAQARPAALVVRMTQGWRPLLRRAATMPAIMAGIATDGFGLRRRL